MRTRQAGNHSNELIDLIVLDNFCCKIVNHGHIYFQTKIRINIYGSSQICVPEEKKAVILE